MRSAPTAAPARGTRARGAPAGKSPPGHGAPAHAGNDTGRASAARSANDDPSGGSAAPNVEDATAHADHPAYPARQRRKEARPHELLEAALTLFVEKGFAATRTEEVAQRAGVSKGTLYLYYPSKEELFKAVVRHNLSSLIAEGEALAGQFEGSSSSLLGRLMRVN